MGRRREDTLAATLRPRLRYLIAWVVGGAAAIFVADLLDPRVLLIVLPTLACIWFAMAVDGVIGTWQWRSAGMPALLLTLMPIVAVPFAAVAWKHTHHWSRVAPSWWLLRSERAAFDRAVSGGPRPAGVLGITRSGGRSAFATVNGMLGNWAGIVHDPTDRLSSADGRNRGPVPADVRYIFRGSETRWCQRLDSHWFHCQFD